MKMLFKSWLILFLNFKNIKVKHNNLTLNFLILITTF